MTIRKGENFGPYNDRITMQLHRMRRSEGNRFDRLDQMLRFDIPLNPFFVLWVGGEDVARDLRNQCKLIRRGYWIAYKKQKAWDRNGR